MKRDKAGAKAKRRAGGGRLTAALLCAAMLLSLMPVSAPVAFAASDRVSYAGEGGVVYFNPQTGYITGTDKKVTKVDIPGEIEGVAVRGIASWALGYNDSLVSVTLPDSIVDIEKGAFYGAHVLREIALPQGVTELPDMAFYECTALKKVSLPAGLETIGKSAFYNCTSLEYVDIPGSVSKVGDLSFYGCSGLKGVYFVEGAEAEIGTWAFNDCYSLEKAVNVPDARWNKFIDSCKRAEVYMNEQELDDHRQMWRLYGDEEKEAAFTALAREITAGCSGDREKVLAISQWLVKRIRYNTEHFDDPPADNETEVWAVFQGIKALEGTGTPYPTTCGGYSNMTQVLCQALGIPAATVWREKKQGETIDHEFNMVYFDGKWRWADTTASDDSKDDSDTQDIDLLDAGRAGFAYSSDHRVDYLLYRKTNKETIYVPIPEDIAITPDVKDWPNQNPEEAYVKGVGYTDPDWEYATSVEDKAAEASKVAQRQADFPALETSSESLFQFNAATGTITGIKDYSVTAISIPDAINGKAVRAIAEKAFSGCRSKVISMPDSITEIGESAFSGCTALERVRLSGGLKELNSYTFSGCASLETITIPKSVKRLAGYIFSGCDRLEEILFEDYAMKEACIATDPRGSDDDYAAGVSNISWYAFKDVGRALYGLDFDATYQRTKWHRALQSVVLTNNWRQNILNVYDSQLDYREGFSPYYVGGTNTRDYKTPGQASYWEWGHFSESGKFHGVDGTTWCYAFTQWAHAMAGIPLTLRSDYYEWKDFTCAGGSYAPQPGDIIGVGATHLAMIGSAVMKDGYMQIQIINGNHPHRNVGKELLRYDPASGKALFIYEDGAWQELNSEDSADYKIRSLYCPRLSEIVTHTLNLDAGEGTTEAHRGGRCLRRTAGGEARRICLRRMVHGENRRRKGAAVSDVPEEGGPDAVRPLHRQAGRGGGDSYQ